jgi:N-acetyl-gamma-glutamyl-phosphate reductase
MGHTVGVVGASGYAGAEVLRLLAGHPDLDVVRVTAGEHVGTPVAEHVPALAATDGHLVYEPTEAARLDGLDVVFVALPHGRSQDLVPELLPRVGLVVDLGADFRLKDPADYARWYGEEHRHPELLAEAVYGLPERGRAGLAGARLVAAPGCYPTAATLALGPLLDAGAVEPTGIVVDAASGVSGAGRAPSDRLHAGTVEGSFTAYGLVSHRHTPEMEQALGAELLFTPHLAPMTRGILATCYARPARSLTEEEALGLLVEAYAEEPFVVVRPDPPATKDTAGSNCAHVTVRVDHRTRWVVALCALDNLVKGAAGQAVQCANLVLGLEETAGLPRAGLFP